MLNKIVTEMKCLSVWILSSKEFSPFDLFWYGIVVLMVQINFLFVILCFPIVVISGIIKNYFAKKESSDDN